MLLFAIAFDVAVDDERFDKFKLGIIADVRIDDGKPDICLTVEYVPNFTHHRQIFRAWRNDWAGNNDPTIRHLLLLAAIKDEDDPMFLPISHGTAIIRKIAELAEQITVVPVD